MKIGKTKSVTDPVIVSSCQDLFGDLLSYLNAGLLNKDNFHEKSGVNTSTYIRTITDCVDASKPFEGEFYDTASGSASNMVIDFIQALNFLDEPEYTVLNSTFILEITPDICS